MTDMIEANMEVEYKFWAGGLSKKTFHDKIVAVAGETYEPLYVCSCDDYYLGQKKGSFLRYRKGGGKTELTLKIKRDGGNTVRKEINLNMTDNDDSSVVEFLTLSGYKKEFSVFKEAWIWHFDDCDVSYYTLSDGRSVIEIEATKYDLTSDGVKIIDDWTEKLNLLSIDEVNREPRSLFEIFTDEKDQEGIADQIAELADDYVKSYSEHTPEPYVING